MKTTDILKHSSNNYLIFGPDNLSENSTNWRGKIAKIINPAFYDL